MYRKLRRTLFRSQIRDILFKGTTLSPPNYDKHGGKSRYFLRPLHDCLIQIACNKNLVDYLLTKRKRERLDGSFLNFVPDLEVTTKDNCCRTVFTDTCNSVAKLHLFHREINNNRDNNLKEPK